ncbi:uncharacterized protein [Arachis hypogaea]|uniref:uncharacterized protein n=1 Tax=Arachis hypogaea TaxID=3818 RepID=UPI003B21A559
MLMKVGKHPDDLVPTNITVTDFSGSSTLTKGLVTLGVKVGSSERNIVFVVVPLKASYNALLGARLDPRCWSCTIYRASKCPSLDRGWFNSKAAPSTFECEPDWLGLSILRFDEGLLHGPGSGYFGLPGQTADLIAEVHCVENQVDVNTINDQVHSISNESVDFSFDYIYDLEPLGFEKHSVKDDEYFKSFESQDPLEEINLGSLENVRITYICKGLVDPFRTELFHLLHEFKDCFAWDYHEMPGLDCSLIEHRLALKPNARPVKQTPRRFTLEIDQKINEEIERYNQIFIAEDDVSKTAFRCLGALGTYEWVVMPFGLKNAVKSISVNQHIDYLRKVFVTMRKKGLKMNPVKCAFGVSAENFLGFVVHKKGIAIDKGKADATLALSAPKSKKEVQSFLEKVNYLRKFISNRPVLLNPQLYLTRVFKPLVKLKNDSQYEWTNEHQQAFDSIKVYLSKASIMANVRLHELLKLYIAASIYTIGCMLTQNDENGHERAVYYLSRVLTDIETRYFPIEKLCLSLYYTCMKLKCYMVAKLVKVIAQTDLIKYMLSFLMLRGRLGKWMLALTEFDLQYVSAKAVKVQIIAYFLVDNSNNLNNQAANVLDIKVNYWKLYFDGSKHKDGAGVEILIISPEGIPSEFLFELKYPCSNNMAEYEALILGLDILIGKGALEVQILGDSQLVLK